MGKELIDIKQAAEILGIKSIPLARKLLNFYDDVEQVKRGVKFLYSKSRVINLKETREANRCCKLMQKGNRCCYLCKNKHKQEDVRSGICENCRAEKLVKNFICRGNCCKNSPDCQLARLLFNAAEKMKKSMSCDENIS